MATHDNRLTVAISYIGRIGGSLASLPATVLIARMLTPKDFGSYTLAFAIVLFGSLLGPLNIGQSALRFASAARGLGDLATARRVALQCVGIGVASLLIVSGGLVLFDAPLRSLLPNLPAGTLNGVLVALWVCATGLLILLGGALRSLDKIELGILVEVTLSRILLLVAVAVLYFTHFNSLTAVLAASAGSSLLVAMFAVVAFLSSLPAVPSAPARERYTVTPKNLLGLAFPLLGVQLLYRIIVDAPFWLVGSFCTGDSVARFAAAYRLWAFFCLPQAAVNSVIEGKIGQLHVRGKDQLEPVARNAAALALVPTVLGTLILIVIGKPLLRMTFGEFYASGHSYLLVLCLFQIISAFLGSSEYLLGMTGHHLTVFATSTFGAVFSVILGFMLVPIYGAMGAAMAIGIAIAAWQLATAWLAWRKLGIKSWVSPEALLSPFTKTVRPPQQYPVTKSDSESASMVTAGADPTLAVVIPNFNYVRFLPEAIESVLAQVPAFDEVIVVNDGSTDNSMEVLGTFGDRIRVIDQKNQGLLGACLTGISAAKSDYVYVLDADDYAAPELMPPVREAIRRWPVKVQFQLEGVNAQRSTLGSIFPTFPDNYDSAQMRVDNHEMGFYQSPPTSGNVWHRETVLKLGLTKDSQPPHLDATANLLMPYLGEVISISRRLAFYRIHGTSMSNWGQPDVKVLHKELSQFWATWETARQVCPTLSATALRTDPLYVLERELMTGALENRLWLLPRVWSLLRRVQTTAIVLRSKVMLTVWATAFLVPLPSVRLAAIKKRRSPAARSKLLKTVIRVLLPSKRSVPAPA